MKIRKLLLALVLTALCLLMTSCGDKQEELTLTCAEIADKVQAAVDFTELTATNESYLEKYLWIDAVDLDDWVLLRDATRATPEMILVVKVKEGADMAAIRKAAEDYHSEQILAYRDYQPAQMPKLEDAKVMENGRYIVLIVSPDAAKVNAVLGNGWK